jgi:hypothetical protein
VRQVAMLARLAVLYIMDAAFLQFVFLFICHFPNNRRVVLFDFFDVFIS